MKKAVIVGCGNIGAVHAQSLKQTEGCQLAALADIRPERAQDYAQRFGGNAYDSLESMLEEEKPDVLHICTPHYLHVPMAVYALERGIHVFMEKPPAISTEQLNQLEEAAAAAKSRIGFCFQNRYNESVKYAKALVDSGKAGRLLGARGIVTWSRNEAYYTESGWRGKLETEGGGALINQAVHTLDLLGYFLGKPVSAEASMCNHHLKGVIEVEDTLEAYIRYENTAASFFATTAYCTDAPVLMEFVCENVTIRIIEPDVCCIWKDGRVERPSLTVAKPLGKSYWGSSHASCIADFYDCLETGRKFRQDLDGVRDTIKLMLAVYESAGCGREVTIS